LDTIFSNKYHSEKYFLLIGIFFLHLSFLLIVLVIAAVILHNLKIYVEKKYIISFFYSYFKYRHLAEKECLTVNLHENMVGNVIPGISRIFFLN
jgi:hypothetical protein